MKKTALIIIILALFIFVGTEIFQRQEAPNPKENSGEIFEEPQSELPAETKATSSAVNQKPVIKSFALAQLHKSDAETPHRYLITLTVEDAENNVPFSYAWSIDCGYFVGDTDKEVVEWRYDNVGECGGVKFTATVTDSAGEKASLTDYPLF